MKNFFMLKVREWNKVNANLLIHPEYAIVPEAQNSTQLQQMSLFKCNFH